MEEDEDELMMEIILGGYYWVPTQDNCRGYLTM